MSIKISDYFPSDEIFTLEQLDEIFQHAIYLNSLDNEIEEGFDSVFIDDNRLLDQKNLDVVKESKKLSQLKLAKNHLKINVSTTHVMSVGTSVKISGEYFDESKFNFKGAA